MTKVHIENLTIYIYLVYQYIVNSKTIVVNDIIAWVCIYLALPIYILYFIIQSPTYIHTVYNGTLFFHILL